MNHNALFTTTLENWQRQFAAALQTAAFVVRQQHVGEELDPADAHLVAHDAVLKAVSMALVVAANADSDPRVMNLLDDGYICRQAEKIVAVLADE